MTNSEKSQSRPLLLIIAGAKGAVASTVAVAVTAMRKDPEIVLPSLTTGYRFPYLGSPGEIYLAGWDSQPADLATCIQKHGVLVDDLWKSYQSAINDIPIIESAPFDLNLSEQIDYLTEDIQVFMGQYPDARPVLINLLPAAARISLNQYQNISELLSKIEPISFPDLAYVLAAIRSGIPVVNFTPNYCEIPPIVKEAVHHSVPITGYDGKTGQTYLKVVLASALKARSFYVDGWYSLNLLGNADGKNLMDPERASGKVANKTELLDDILGYPVGQRYGETSHKVRIDYYAPRGDAKEAWDVIDFKGLFGLPMSIRLNLQGRDSILAAPLVLDLARWMTALKMAGRSGTVPELAFYFKKPVGENPPRSFQNQVSCLRTLEKECNQKISS